MKFAHILFPVDFSDHTTQAAPHVNAMATQFGSRVTLLHVIAPPIYQTSVPVATEVLRNRLDALAKESLSGIETDHLIEVGEPAAVIARLAAERSSDLIMMPTQGYGPFRRLLVGSVTAKVLHDVPSPVWTSPHSDAFLGVHHLPCKKVLCAVDLSPRAVELMKWSADFSKALGADLRFVHAVPHDQTWETRQFGPDLVDDLRKEAKEKITEYQKEAGLDLPLCIGLGNPGEAVREEAKTHNADLVIIGRGAITGTLGRLRAHAYSIIRQAPCPVISV